MAKKKVVEQCCFEEWDSKNRRMGHCESIATHRIGNKKVCKFHGDYAMAIREHMPGNHKVVLHSLDEKRVSAKK